MISVMLTSVVILHDEINIIVEFDCDSSLTKMKFTRYSIIKEVEFIFLSFCHCELSFWKAGCCHCLSIKPGLLQSFDFHQVNQWLRVVCPSQMLVI